MQRVASASGSETAQVSTDAALKQPTAGSAAYGPPRRRPSAERLPPLAQDHDTSVFAFEVILGYYKAILHVVVDWGMRWEFRLSRKL
jgi:hypothetical protein